MKRFIFTALPFFIYGLTIEFILVILNVWDGYNEEYYIANIGLSIIFSLGIIIYKKYYKK